MGRSMRIAARLHCSASTSSSSAAATSASVFVSRAAACTSLHPSARRGAAPCSGHGRRRSASLAAVDRRERERKSERGV
ncbi:Os05g0130500 [Oryza sativa Japonica Group]|uniref:Os05g0130500 protein n=2 Tax=Oryza sativa subsp. japonica TaxID=39947 RepID=C7J2H0_ORYSJ|nr:unknown protein [Oryza sativa Japonica Group]BAH92930.1 Os05g0130500 [Oryza sativa Japonica Group]BAS92111.1 Os05g0130500 [Oryza sativa Japonica Group]|eukprot:NP_001174202.1 Os05g0130500 [Oryza sativa Japonica Group]